MELCSDGHEEVVYESGSKYTRCPVCEALKELEEAEQMIADLESELEAEKGSE